jgi:hypothetical protein
MRVRTRGLVCLIARSFVPVGNTPCLASSKEATVRKALGARYVKRVAAYMSRDSRAAVQFYENETTPDDTDRSPHGGKALVPTSREEILLSGVRAIQPLDHRAVRVAASRRITQSSMSGASGLLHSGLWASGRAAYSPVRGLYRRAL